MDHITGQHRPGPAISAQTVHADRPVLEQLFVDIFHGPVNLFGDWGLPVRDGQMQRLECHRIQDFVIERGFRERHERLDPLIAQEGQVYF